MKGFIRSYEWMGLLLILFLLTSCGQPEEEHSTGENIPSTEPIEVEMDIPESAELGEEVELAAFVTQKEEPVADASEVLFEVWAEDEKENSEEIQAEGSEAGRYSIAYTFKEEGQYHVTAHVTARNMHSMPTEEVIIGQPEESAQEQAEAHEGFHHEHGSPVSVELQSSEITASPEEKLTFTVKYEGEPVTNARVRLEIWKIGEGSRQWEDAEEISSGEYAASHTFQHSGDHIMTVHVENDEDLHEHTEKMITVKE